MTHSMPKETLRTSDVSAAAREPGGTEHDRRSKVEEHERTKYEQSAGSTEPQEMSLEALLAERERLIKLLAEKTEEAEILKKAKTFFAENTKE
jgi:transposase-like protein